VARTKAEIETGAERPRALAVEPAGIPEALARLPQWVGWRYRRRKDKAGKLKWTKLPINPRGGQLAKADDPRTWGTFKQALALCGAGQADGIGFVFSEDDPFAGVDLDDCRNPETGKLESWAARVVEEFSSYTEVSPSGTGVKIFAVGVLLPGGRNRSGNIEVYDRKRYFVVTGRCCPGTPAGLEQREEQLQALQRRLAEKKSPNKAEAPRADLTDLELIEKAKAAKNGAKFARLFAGDTSGYGSPSEADLALCSILAFWAQGDPARIDALFRQSGLYRDKWERADYRKDTIARALEGRTEFYRGQVNGQGGATPPGPARGPVRQTGYDIILAYFRDKYRPIFRRATWLYSEALGREVRIGEACCAPSQVLVQQLEGASDAPRYGDGTVKRADLPKFFATWARVAWVDLLDNLPEEEDSAEVNDPAREQFRAKVAAALLAIQSFTYAYRQGQAERTEVQRRSLLDWCRVWAKAGSWQSVRSLPVWTRLDADGHLCVALRLELFGVLGKPEPTGTKTKFARLAELYDVGSAERVARARAIELSADFIKDLTEQPGAVDGLSDDGCSHARPRENEAPKRQPEA
jgi:hypothetical protein